MKLSSDGNLAQESQRNEHAMTINYYFSQEAESVLSLGQGRGHLQNNAKKRLLGLTTLYFSCP